MSNFDEILGAARLLTATEQLRLVEALRDSASPDEWPVPSSEWIAEAQRRSTAYDEGRMPASTWSEVRERTRKKAGLDE